MVCSVSWKCETTRLMCAGAPATPGSAQPRAMRLTSVVCAAICATPLPKAPALPAASAWQPAVFCCPG